MIRFVLQRIDARLDSMTILDGKRFMGCDAQYKPNNYKHVTCSACGERGVLYFQCVDCGGWFCNMDCGAKKHCSRYEGLDDDVDDFCSVGSVDCGVIGCDGEYCACQAGRFTCTKCGRGHVDSVGYQCYTCRRWFCDPSCAGRNKCGGWEEDDLGDDSGPSEAENLVDMGPIRRMNETLRQAKLLREEKKKLLRPLPPPLRS